MTNKEQLAFKKFIRKDLLSKGLQQCNICYEIKTLDEFYPNKKFKSGKQYYCKECHKNLMENCTIILTKNYLKLYIRTTYNIKWSEITEEMLETIKIKLTLSRKLKQITNENKVKP